MEEITTTSGIVALGAAAAALVALLSCAVLWLRVRRLRKAQTTVLGGEQRRDLVEHASQLEGRLAALGEELSAAVERLNSRDLQLDRRLDGAIIHCGVVRYDAMGEMTGRQSSSVALLDSHRTGVVLSSILHREQARLYAKGIIEGRSEFELSPEEQEALDVALDARGAAS